MIYLVISLIHEYLQLETKRNLCAVWSFKKCGKYQAER